MVRLLKNLRFKDWILVVLIVGFVVAQVMFDLALPDYMKKIVDLIQDQKTTSDIWSVGFIMLGISLGSVICTIIVSFMAAIVAASLAKRVRRKIFAKINEFSLEEINGFSTSSLITRSTNDITQIQLVVVMILRLALSAPIMAVGAIIKIVNKNMTLTWVTGIAIVLMFILILFMFVCVAPRFTRLQKQTDRINLVTRENLTGLRVVRAYNAEGVESEKFTKANDELTKTNRFVNRATSIMMPGMQLIMSGLTLAIIWIGAYLINGNTLDLANMSAFTQYAMQVLISFMMLSMLFVLMPRAIVSAKRINEVLNTQINISDGKGEVPADIKGEVEFRNVSFKYPGAEDYVLQDINFKAHHGDTVAFIGSTGSGKSTLINLIPRFYDVTEGEVLVDGMNVKDYKLKELYAKMGYVPQKGVLFSGSIDENIRYGNERATEEEVDEALRVAQATDFVNGFDKKKRHHISQGGKNVSGGQKQRLSIARAIAKNPELYIFDDSFSALDYKTDKKLRAELKNKISGATNLIVAQRIGTIMDADKIIVLDQGRIVGEGTHKELLETCETYREIAYSQLSEEELSK